MFVVFQHNGFKYFQENELLYDKGHEDCKLTEKKNALWKDKTDELGLCDGELRYKMYN
jgi:hypothetical protein